jgi:dihydropyrimidinase
MLDILIKNAKIVKNGQETILDVGIENGKFVYFGLGQTFEAKKVIEANKSYVLPGVIDVHTHVEQKTGPIPLCDSYADASKAAVAGGTTTYISFIFQNKEETIQETVKKKMALAKKQSVNDFGFHIGYTHVTEEALDEMDALSEAGFKSLKIFMSCGNLMVEDGPLTKVLEKGKKDNMLVCLHAENESICTTLEKDLEAAGTLGMENYAKSRPGYAEGEAVRRAIYLSEQLDVPIYIVHLTCKEALLEVQQARKAGKKVFAETCPHYLMFTDEKYLEPDSYKNLMGPPLRAQEDIDLLWQAISDGELDIISTDHCPYTLEDKKVGLTDFRKISPGIPGIEFLLKGVYTQGVVAGKISMERMLEVLCYNPAKIFGMPDKGRLEVGMDADFVVFDETYKEVVKRDNLHMKSGYTLLEGETLYGNVLYTGVRGKVVFENNEVTGNEGDGKFIQLHR